EYRDRERKAGLDLVNARDAPIFRRSAQTTGVGKSRQRIHRAEYKAMTNVAPGAFFRGQGVIVLRNGSLKHRRPEIRRVAQVLRPGVVAEEGQTMREAAADIDVPGVVPALCRVLQQVDGTDREDCAYQVEVGRQDRIRHEADGFERTARTDGARTRRSVIHQV